MGGDLLPELLMSSRLEGVQQEKCRNQWPLLHSPQPPVASEGRSEMLKMWLWVTALAPISSSAPVIQCRLASRCRPQCIIIIMLVN
jgi:hypothetical protein